MSELRDGQRVISVEFDNETSIEFTEADNARITMENGGMGYLVCVAYTYKGDRVICPVASLSTVVVRDE